jgi:hypothetical protein
MYHSQSPTKFSTYSLLNEENSVSNPDPGSGAFLTSESGIGFFQILGPRSRIPDPQTI